MVELDSPLNEFNFLSPAFPQYSYSDAIYLSVCIPIYLDWPADLLSTLLLLRRIHFPRLTITSCQFPINTLLSTDTKLWLMTANIWRALKTPEVLSHPQRLQFHCLRV